MFQEVISGLLIEEAELDLTEVLHDVMSVPCFIRDVEFPYLGADDVLQGEPVLTPGHVGVELEECVTVLPRAEDGVLEGLEFIIEGFEFWGWGDPVGSVILDLHGLPVDGFTHGFTSLLVCLIVS